MAESGKGFCMEKGLFEANAVNEGRESVCERSVIDHQEQARHPSRKRGQGPAEMPGAG